MDIVVRLYRVDLLPDCLWKLIEAEHIGAAAQSAAAASPGTPGTPSTPGATPGSGRTRRSRQAAGGSGSRYSLAPGSFFRTVGSQITSLITMPSEPEFSGALALFSHVLQFIVPPYSSPAV